jgi:DnaJ-class molecular chaperone
MKKKQNEQSYHNKSSDSNQHNTFDDRLDELKSNIAKCYEILEVPQNATPSEIKAAFKKKMSSYHPDKVSGLGEKLRKVAEEESKLINVAYQNLKSEGKC